MTDLPDWARQLDLAPHPEGGWFRETWRSELSIAQSALPPDYTGPRNAGTAILFLLMPGQQSAWHTVRSAELWFYHRGGPLLLEVGAELDTATTYLLGSDVAAGEQAQLVVPGQLRGGTGFRLRRLHHARVDSSRTAAATRSALPAAVDPSGNRRVSSIPIRVWTPT